MLEFYSKKKIFKANGLTDGKEKEFLKKKTDWKDLLVEEATFYFKKLNEIFVLTSSAVAKVISAPVNLLQAIRNR